jgi:hypothetical protein
MSFFEKSSLLKAVAGYENTAHPKKVYHGSRRVVMNLNGSENFIVGRVDHERAIFDGFLELMRQEHIVESSSYNNKRIVIKLKGRAGVSQAFLKKIKKAEITVYHIDFGKDDWDQYYPEIKTYVSSKNLTMKVDRYESVNVGDWLANKTLEFSERHDLGFRDVDLQQLVR